MTLETKILADLEKSGFGSEMRAAQLLVNSGWLVTSGYGYFDHDKRISRDLDLRANNTRRIVVGSKSAITVYTYLAVEVKKAKHPWVVFIHGSPQRRSGGAWGQLIDARNLPVRGFDLVPALEQISLAPELGWRGYGVHEAFKPADKPSRWWRAAVAAIKGAEGVVEAQGIDPSRRPEELSKDLLAKACEIHFVKPVVLLDGLLFTASLREDGSVQIDTASSAPITMQFKTERYNSRHRYYVDLVTLTGFAAYLDRLGQRTDVFVDAIAQKAGIDSSAYSIERTPIEY